MCDTGLLILQECYSAPPLELGSTQTTAGTADPEVHHVLVVKEHGSCRAGTAAWDRRQGP
jgi:hypothetical protein